jgi:hypothetical protein
VKLIWFDYHHHFAEHQSHGLLPLFQHIQEGIENDGSLFLQYQLPTIFEKQQIQTKIIRTNCLDCLDRTNVVQVKLYSITSLYKIYTYPYFLCDANRV